MSARLLQLKYCPFLEVTLDMVTCGFLRGFFAAQEEVRTGERGPGLGTAGHAQQRSRSASAVRSLGALAAHEGLTKSA